MNKILTLVLLSVCFLVYTGIVYTAGTESSDLLSEKAIHGKLLFQKHNCISCHQIYGLGGYIGPELTESTFKVKGNTSFLKAILKTGTQRMPDFKLSDDEIDCLVEYLTCINASAASVKNDESSAHL
jgi:nitric oxide reductase subunit C